MPLLSPQLSARLVHHAEAADRSVDWPTASWGVLRASGFLNHSIPPEFGGAGIPTDTLQAEMEEIASCCLTTAFALSQREAAIRQLLKGPETLRQRYLPRLAAGEDFATVGLSQLTTSRQHQAPSLQAVPQSDGGYILNGEVPWVTGADQASVMVIGATRTDDLQVLLAVPAFAVQAMIAPPLPLAALAGSRTSLIRMRDVRLGPDDVIAGPTESVLGKSGGGGLETSCLALGLATAAIGNMAREATVRKDLEPIVLSFQISRDRLRSQLRQMVLSPPNPESVLALRAECTQFVLKATQAALMVAKGAGFVMPHPTQLWARQALFFLVWSCPRPVATEVLAELASFGETC